MSRHTKTKKSIKRRHRKSHTRGGMPLEYFGSSTGRYFASGDSNLVPGTSAYGPFMEVSQGVPSLDGMVGPNVAPYQGASCTQTGGRKSRSRKSRSHKSRSHKSRSHKSRSHKSRSRKSRSNRK